MPFLVAVQLLWDSSELGNLQKKKNTVQLQVNDKSLLKKYFVLKLPPPLLGSLKYTRARKNGRSTDNARTDWGILPVMLTSQIRSYGKRNKFTFPFCSVVSVVSVVPVSSAELLCIAEI